MWKAAFGGKSERESDRKDTASSSGRRRHRKDDDEASVVTAVSRRTDSSRKKHRRHKDDDEDDRERSRRSESSGLTETAIRALENDEDWEDDDDETKSERRSKRSGKSRTDRGDKERRREKDRGEKPRGAVEDYRDERRRSTVDDDTDRRRRAAEEQPSRPRERAQRDELAGTSTSRALPDMDPLDQFPGMHNAQISRPQEHMMSGALPTLDSHVPNQFPGQMPATYSSPASQLNPHGEAADYYNDQGQSVHNQPGVRPASPMMLVNPDTHLFTPSAEAAPVADTGNGAAADFYSGKISPVSFQAQTSNGPESRPTKPSSRPSNGVAGAAAAAAGAAIAGLAGKQSRPTPGKPGRHNSAPSVAPNGTIYEAPPMITGKLTESPQTNNAGLYTAAGAAVGAAALGAAAYGMSHHDTGASGRPPSYHSPGSRPYAEGPYPPGMQGSYYAPAGVVLEQHHHREHRGPIERLKDGILDMIADPDDVRKMEAYTEYIGVCKHCFDPRSSPWDGPRKHHYHPRSRDSFESLRKRASTDKLRRKSSGERVGGTSRIEKEARYAASDSSRRRPGMSKAEMAGLGAVGMGAVTTGAMLWRDGKDFDDTYSVKSGHRATSAARRRSRSSSHERRRRSSYGVIGPDRETKEKWVTVRTRDGRTERRKVHARSRSRSVSHGSRDRQSSRFGNTAGAIAGVALAGAALPAAKSHSPERRRKDDKVLVRRKSHGRSRSRSSSPGGFSGRGYRREGRRSPTKTYSTVQRQRSRSRDGEGLFGGFFSSPKKSKDHKKKQTGFFTFSNDSASSTEGLAFGDGFVSRSSLGRRASNSSLKNKRNLKRRTSEERVAAAVAGIGVTAAALAAAQRGARVSKHGHKTELGAHRETRQVVEGRNINGDDDAWEDELPSEASGASSDDAGLAFGEDHRRGRMSRQSMESIASKSSDGGMGAWGWRWGSKKQKNKSSRPSDPYTPRPTGHSSPAVTGSSSRDARQVSSSASGVKPPMQYIDPRPLAEPSSASSSRHATMPGAFDSYDSPSVQRPSVAPLQQPQPLAPISPAFTKGLNDNPMKMVEASRQTPTKPRRSQTMPAENGYGSIIGDAALIGGAAIATARIIAAQQSKKSRDSNVRFGLTDEQQRKDDAARQLEQDRERQRAEEEQHRERERERQQKEDERRRAERAEAAKEEARRAAREEDERRARAEREAESKRAARAEDERRAQAAREEEERQTKLRREEDERQAKLRREAEREAETRRAAREAEDRRVYELERRAEEARREAERKTQERKASELALAAAAAAEHERKRQAEEHERQQREEAERLWEAEAEARFRARYEAEERARAEAEARDRESSRSATGGGRQQREAKDFEDEDDRRRRDKQRDVDEDERLDTDERHGKKPKRKESLGRASKDNAWATPVAAGIAGALTGAVIDGALHKGRDGKSSDEKSRTKDVSPPRYQTVVPTSEHSGPPITDDDLFDPDFFSKSRKRSQSEVKREVELVKKAADKVIQDREDYYNAPSQSQAEIFAPKELLNKAAGEKERSTDPMGGNQVQVWHSAEAEVREHFKHPAFAQDQYDIVRDKLGRPVPRLNVIAPTPPPASPGISPVDLKNKDTQARAGAERGREAEKDEKPTTQRSRAVSWGEDQTHVYQVQTPESIIEKDSYVSSKEIPPSASTPLHDEIVVEHDDEDGSSRTVRYGKDDLSESSKAPREDDEKDVEEISRDDEESEYFADASDFRQKPQFFDSVSNVGFAVDSPGTEGAPPVRGWVEDEEVDDATPKDESGPPIRSNAKDVELSERQAQAAKPPAKAGTGSRLASLIGAALAGAGATSVSSKPVAEPVVEEAAQKDTASPIAAVETESAWEPPLSKKDKKKRDKLAKRQSMTDETIQEPEATEEATQTAPDSAQNADKDDFFNFTSNKDKKKRGKAAKRGSIADSDADFVDARETDEPDPPTLPAEEPSWTPPLSKKEQKKRDKLANRDPTYEDDDVTARSTPANETQEITPAELEPVIEAIWQPPLSKKEQKKRDKLAKRGLSYDDDSFPDSPANEPEEQAAVERPVVEEPTWDPPLSKKEKKKRGKLAKRGLSYDDDSFPSTPASESEDPGMRPRDGAEEQTLSQDDKDRVEKLLGRKGGVTDVVGAVMTAGGIAALAHAATQEESVPAAKVEIEEEDDIWATPSKKSKASKRKKKLGEPLDRDPRDFEPSVVHDDAAQGGDRSSDSSTTKADKRRSMPGGWDEEEARREDNTASESDSKLIAADKPADSNNDDDVWSGYESKKSKKDKKKGKRNSIFNEPTVSSPLRSEVQHEDYISSKDSRSPAAPERARSASNEQNGHYTNGHDDLSQSTTEPLPDQDTVPDTWDDDADEADVALEKDGDRSSTRRRKHRSRHEDDDTRSTTSSGHSRRSKDEQVVAEKKGILGSIFGRKSSDAAPTKTSSRSDKDDDETSRQRRRRRTESEYGDDDDSKSVASSGRRHRHREDDDQDDPRHRHRSKDSDKNHTSEDQSFLGNWVEDLPPLPRSRSASPVSALEREEQEEGSPVSADIVVAKHQGEPTLSGEDEPPLALEDLPPLPETPPRSPQFRPFPVRPSVASTSIPLRFKPPPPSPQSQTHSRSTSLDSPIELASSPASVPRQRTPRGRTTDVRSGEFKPLYLAEIHSKPVEPIEDDLPSLPSSKPSSRASSVHDSEQFHSAAQSIYSSPTGAKQLRLDTGLTREHRSADDMLGSEQTTPRASEFGHSEADSLQTRSQPQFYTWEDLMREEAQSDRQGERFYEREKEPDLATIPALPPSRPTSPELVTANHVPEHEQLGSRSEAIVAGAASLAALTAADFLNDKNHERPVERSVQDVVYERSMAQDTVQETSASVPSIDEVELPVVKQKLSKKAARKAKKARQLSYEDDSMASQTDSSPAATVQDVVSSTKDISPPVDRPAETASQVVDADSRDEPTFKGKKRKDKKGNASVLDFAKISTAADDRAPDESAEIADYFAEEARLEAGTIADKHAPIEYASASQQEEASSSQQDDTQAATPSFVVGEAPLVVSTSVAPELSTTEVDSEATTKHIDTADLASDVPVNLNDRPASSQVVTEVSEGLVADAMLEQTATSDEYKTTIGDGNPQASLIESPFVTDKSLEDEMLKEKTSDTRSAPAPMQTTQEFLNAEQQLEAGVATKDPEQALEEPQGNVQDVGLATPQQTEETVSTDAMARDLPADNGVGHYTQQLQPAEEAADDDWLASFPKKQSKKDKRKQKKSKAAALDVEEPDTNDQAASLATVSPLLDSVSSVPIDAALRASTELPEASSPSQPQQAATETPASTIDDDLDFAPAKKSKKGKKGKKSQKLDVWAEEPNVPAETEIVPDIPRPASVITVNPDLAPFDETTVVANPEEVPQLSPIPADGDKSLRDATPTDITDAQIGEASDHDMVHTHGTKEASIAQPDEPEDDKSVLVREDSKPYGAESSQATTDAVRHSHGDVVPTASPIVAEPPPVEDDAFVPFTKKSKKDKRKKRATLWDDLDSKDSTDLSSVETSQVVVPVIAATAALATVATAAGEDASTDDFWAAAPKKLSKKDKRKSKKSAYQAFDLDEEVKAETPLRAESETVSAAGQEMISEVVPLSDSRTASNSDTPSILQPSEQEMTVPLEPVTPLEPVLALPEEYKAAPEHDKSLSLVAEGGTDRDQEQEKAHELSQATPLVTSEVQVPDTSRSPSPAHGPDVMYGGKADITKDALSRAVSPPGDASASTPALRDGLAEQPQGQDLDFAATLAAGLQDAGFDPDLVVNDPVFHRRASPIGVAEADPEELGDFVPTKLRRGKRSSASSTPQQASSDNEILKTGPDDFDALLSRGLEDSGFDAGLLEQPTVRKQSEDVRDTEDDETISTTTKRKGKKNKRATMQALTEDAASSASTKPILGKVLDTNEDKMVSDHTDPLHSPRMLSTGPQSHSEAPMFVAKEPVGAVNVEVEPEELDWSVGTKKRGKKNKKSGPAVIETVPAVQSEQEDTHDLQVEESFGDVAGAVNMLGGDGELDIDEQDKAYREYKKNKRKAKKSKYAALATGSTDNTPTSAPQNEDYTASKTLPLDQSGLGMSAEDANTLSRAATPDERRRGNTVTLDISEGTQAHSETRGVDSLVAGALLSGTTATTGAALARSQSPTSLRDEPSWSFSPIDREQSLDRDINAVHPQETTNIRQSTSQESLSTKRSIEPLHVQTESGPSWSLAMPKHRADQGQRAQLEAPRSRTPSSETPLEPTSRNRASYLFQATPDTTPENRAKQVILESHADDLEPRSAGIVRALDGRSPVYEPAPILGTIVEETHAIKQNIALHRELSPSEEAKRRAVSSPLYAGQEERPTLSRRVFSDHRSPSVLSNRSAASNGFPRIPEELRSFDRASSVGSATPSLRRISMSGDLRAASRASNRRGESGSAVGQHSSPKTIPFEPPPTPPLYDEDIIDQGASRAVGMADVYQGYGDHQGSHISPTRPPSVRKRQSMHIIELESRLDQLAAENRALSEARRQMHGSEQDHGLRQILEQREYELHEKDAELTRMRAALAPMQLELQRLTQINKDLVDDANLRYTTLQAEHDHAHEQWQSSSRELDVLRSQQVKLATDVRDAIAPELNAALAQKDGEIRRLQEELDLAKERIRALQVSIQSNRDATFLNERDEDYIDGACQKLCQHTQQWVLRFSKTSDKRICRLSTEIADEKIEARLDNAILDGSDVDKLLSDRVKRRDVFMSVVTTMIWEYVFSRYLFGLDREQRQKLKTLERTLTEVGPPRAVTQWRAITLSLLSRRPAFQEQCDLDTEAVSHEIFAVLCTLLPPPSSSEQQLLQSLQRVVKIAVELHVEMRTQRAQYIMLPPLQPDYDTNGDLIRQMYFNSQLMNERSGNYSSNAELDAQQAVVKIVLFPPIVRRGDNYGEGADELIVCPAQVLVHNDGGKGKKVVRVMSGAMQIDDGRASRMSFTSTAPTQSAI